MMDDVNIATAVVDNRKKKKFISLKELKKRAEKTHTPLLRLKSRRQCRHRYKMRDQYFFTL